MLAITNIAELVAVPPGPIGGCRMDAVPRVRDAAIFIDGEIIAWFGPRDQLQVPAGCEMLDAGGCTVVPGLIDCHTHLVYAGTREDEFVRRIRGESYSAIAESGGGILSTVRAVRAATEDELVEAARARLRRMLEAGTTTAEVKSGYGLTPADELKMLRAVRRLAAEQPVELVGTYLAAHAVPPEFAGRPDEYLDLMLAPEVLDALRTESLAEFCDVFCERGAFDVARSRRVLEAGKRHGLLPRVHADQITQMGASCLAAEVGAVSVDHLEKIDDGGIEALCAAGARIPSRTHDAGASPVAAGASPDVHRESRNPLTITPQESSWEGIPTEAGARWESRTSGQARTVAVLLPGCSFFLGVNHAPARKLLEADLPVALATDLNPGSSLIESLALVLSLACTQLRMTPAEALTAATANAAVALARQHRLGAIHPGHQADLLILDVPNLEQWPYHVGRNCVRTVVKRGRVVVGA